MNPLLYYYSFVLGIRYLPASLSEMGHQEIPKGDPKEIAQGGPADEETHAVLLNPGDIVWIDDGTLEQSPLFAKINHAIEQEAQRVGRTIQIAMIPQEVPLVELLSLHPDVHFLFVDPVLYQTLSRHISPAVQKQHIYRVPHPKSLEGNPSLKAQFWQLLLKMVRQPVGRVENQNVSE